MVKKEKRIFIGFINPEGDSCPVPYGKCNSLCDNCKGGMTRQEAIERIGNAILRVQVTDAEYCCNTFAEAALNSLLERL